ncbi:MAG: hypothetical protein FP831_03275 [Anaerolineae bacterium]|nr:hypothetical protein [Anaerolineae bacterium]
MYTWDSFLDTADQFFISYSCGPLLIPVKLFEIGHCVELYLKATLTKLTSIENAMSYNHRIRDIFNECKKLDGKILADFEIRNAVFESNFINNQFDGLSESDLHHLFEFREFYTISKHLLDIKYIGAPQKTVKREGTVWIIESPNLYWIKFIKDLRCYLGWPTLHHRDLIKEIIKTNEIPVSAKIYLQNLFN